MVDCSYMNALIPHKETPKKSMKTIEEEENNTKEEKSFSAEENIDNEIPGNDAHATNPKKNLPLAVSTPVINSKVVLSNRATSMANVAV